MHPPNGRERLLYALGALLTVAGALWVHPGVLVVLVGLLVLRAAERRHGNRVVQEKVAAMKETKRQVEGLTAQLRAAQASDGRAGWS